MILATAGHIDHGKTSLVRILTGIDADRLPEEKRRGLTIDLGFAYTTLPDGTELGFVDVPGHERFLPNMLAGILSIDRVLLIVAADDGPRPQTLEHLDILELIGVAEITGIVTKIDRVEAARQAAVVDEVATLLADSGFDDAPIFAVSSRTGDGIAALREHLRRAAECPIRDPQGEAATRGFRLPIDRAFSLPGAGLVVTGTVAAGAVAIGDRLALGPRGIAARVRGIHAQNRAAETAAVGERCAVNLIGTFPEGSEPRRGDWLVAPELYKPIDRIDVRLRVSRAAPAPLRDGLPVHVHLGTEDLVARAAVLGARSIAAGEDGFVQLHLERPTGALYGDRVVLRDHGARHTLAGGRVVDPFPPRRGRSRPERLAALAALAEADPVQALERLLIVEGVVDLPRFVLARNLAPGELDWVIEAGGFLRIGPPRSPMAVSQARLDAAADTLVDALAAAHRALPDTLGPTRSALLGPLRSKTPEPVLDTALARLIADETIVRDGAALRLAAHQPRLSRADERLWERVRPLLAAGDLRPPRVREMAETLGLEPDTIARFLKRVARFGRVAPVAGNRYFLPETVVRLAEIARELAADSPEGGFSAIAFRDRSGVGRNVTIEILEYLDAIGVTRRAGDTRIVLRDGDPL